MLRYFVTDVKLFLNKKHPVASLTNFSEKLNA